MRYAFLRAACAFVIGVFPGPLVAQDDSGTNPISFTFDFRMFMEAQSLPGDNTLLNYTFEYRAPLSGKLAARFRGRATS